MKVTSHKSLGSEEMHPRVLRELADVVAIKSHGGQEKSLVTGKVKHQSDF